MRRFPHQNPKHKIHQIAIMKLVKVCTLTTPELERMANELKPYTQIDFFIIKGIRAEIAERTGSSLDALLEEIEKAKDETTSAQDEVDDLASKVRNLEEQNKKLENQNTKLLDQIKDL